jgi:hypothetical protein
MFMVVIASSVKVVLMFKSRRSRDDKITFNPPDGSSFSTCLVLAFGHPSVCVTPDVPGVRKSKDRSLFYLLHENIRNIVS